MRRALIKTLKCEMLGAELLSYSYALYSVQVPFTLMTIYLLSRVLHLTTMYARVALQAHKPQVEPGQL